MAERPHYFGSWCVLFTDAVCLAGAYCLVGTAGSDTMVALSLPIWIVWMSVCYGLLALFLRRPHTTGQLAIVGLSALCSRRCPGFVKLRSFRCLQPALWPGLSVGHTATHHLFTDRALQTPNTHELCGAICFCCAGLSADPAGRHCAARFLQSLHFSGRCALLPLSHWHAVVPQWYLLGSVFPWACSSSFGRLRLSNCHLFLGDPFCIWSCTAGHSACMGSSEGHSWNRGQRSILRHYVFALTAAGGRGGRRCTAAASVILFRCRNYGAGQCHAACLADASCHSRYDCTASADCNAGPAGYQTWRSSETLFRHNTAH